MRVGIPAFQPTHTAKSSARVTSATVATPTLGRNAALPPANSLVQRKPNGFAASHAQQRIGHPSLCVPSQKSSTAARHPQGRVQSTTSHPFIPSHDQKNLATRVIGNGTRPAIPLSAMKLRGNNPQSSPPLPKIPALVQAKPIQVNGPAWRNSVAAPPAATRNKNLTSYGLPQAAPTRFNHSTNATIQRLQLHKNQLVSSFDKAKLITKSQAVITARSSDALHGGHASIYLEYLNEKDEGDMLRIDMFYNESDYSIVVRSWRIAHEYNPSHWYTRMLFSRQIMWDNREKLQLSGQYQAYAMLANKVQAVIARADAIKVQGERGEISYGLTATKIRNLNPFSSVTYMNCADFAAELLQAAGVGGSSGLLSMPITVSARDTRTPEEIYHSIAVTVS